MVTQLWHVQSSALNLLEPRNWPNPLSGIVQKEDRGFRRHPACRQWIQQRNRLVVRHHSDSKKQKNQQSFHISRMSSSYTSRGSNTTMQRGRT